MAMKESKKFVFNTSDFEPVNESAQSSVKPFSAHDFDPINNQPQPAIDRQKQFQQFSQAAGGDNQPGFMSNFSGGLLNSINSTLKNLPDINKLSPPNMQKIMPTAKPLDFDAYKAMGSTEQPFNVLPKGEMTIPGAEQTAGELFSPNQAGATGLIKGITSPVTDAFAHINPQDISKSIQSSHDVMKKSAEDIFDKVGTYARQRGADVIPIEKSLVDAVSSYLPNTKAAKNLLSRLASGDFQALRDVQSELFHRGTKASKSLLPSESNKGEEMMDLRDKVNDAISNYFHETGNFDLNKDLDKAKSIYKNLKDTYYGKTVPAAIKKLVHPDTRKMPSNIFKTLDEDSVSMNRIKSQNPIASKALDLNKRKENAIQRLKYLGYGGATTLGLLESYNLFKKLFPMGGETSNQTQ